MIRSSAEAVPARNSIPNIAVQAPTTIGCHFMETLSPRELKGRRL
jgi:hypothetical protein